MIHSPIRDAFLADFWLGEEAKLSTPVVLWKRQGGEEILGEPGEGDGHVAQIGLVEDTSRRGEGGFFQPSCTALGSAGAVWNKE